MGATREKEAGMYQCGLCKAEYGRADHLVRHVRSHTKQRPFICTVCGKGFARQDLLKRHLATHTKEPSNGPNVVAEAEAAMQAQLDRHSHRASQACRSCAAKKVKCTNSKPCERCQEHGLQCDYEQRIASDIALPPLDLVRREETMPDAQVQDSFPSSSITTAPIPMGGAFDNELPAKHRHDNDTAVKDHGSTDNMPRSHDFIASQNNVVQDILSSTLTLPDFGDYIDIDTDPVLGEIDFAFLNDPFLSNDAPRPLLIDPWTTTTTATEPVSKITGVIAEAYRSSRVHRGWEPGREEHQGIEHQNLNLPPGTSPECLVSSVQPISILRKSLSSSTRDRILAMIFRTCSPQAAERVVESFPTRQVLGDLINFAFVRMADLQAISMIHVPSLDLNEQRPELLAAFIAYGSTCSPSPALRRFGYAIQEAVRVATNQLAEERHAVLRKQDVCQAFYIQLYLAYWSAISRKIEMAESMSMLGTTLLRRGKMLQGQIYAAPEHFLNLPGLSVHVQWLKWVEQESRKRLVYFAFTLDAHISVARDTNILFPYSELETPLPSAMRLWEAESAAKWQDILQNDPELRNQQPESLCTILRRPYLSSTRTTLSDAKCWDMAFLAGFWAFIHEYQEMNAVLRRVHSSNDFVLKSRYTELKTALEQLRAELANLDNASPEVLILQDFMGLHLEVAFYELSKYAGIGTDADARLAVPYVQKWAESPQSHAALWHAGQIFRVTRLLPTGNLTDIYVVALYHAAVTLWVWGLLFRTQGAVLNDIAQTVVLDGDETPAVSKFLRASHMLPGLTGTSGQFLSLDNLTVAPDLAHEIIMSNLGTQPLQLTADEVSRLMQGISGICRQKFREVPG